LSALIRLILRRKTVGIFLQPLGIARNDTIKDVFKVLLLSLLVKLNLLVIFSIYPRRLAFGFFKYYSEWIIDPAFWDLSEETRLPDKLTNDVISSYKFETDILYVLFLGTISNRKRFDLFVECCVVNNNFPGVKFIAVGEKYISKYNVRDVVQEEIFTKFSDFGGVFIEKYLTEEEVVYFQKNTHLHWAFYAENFNQSSGVAGRAYQLNKHVIVRKNSIISEMLYDLDFPMIALTEFELLSIFESNHLFDYLSVNASTLTKPASLRNRSLKVLYSSYGIT
jgi:glycosyltransferase involved in cell wall biosynthesis